MAAIILHRYRHRRMLRINIIFIDRTHPFEAFDDEKLFRNFRFIRHYIIAITDDIEREINIANRTGSLSPLLQVVVTLRYYVSGIFQDVCDELMGIDQSTVSRIVTGVSDAFLLKFLTTLDCPISAKQTGRRPSFTKPMGSPM